MTTLGKKALATQMLAASLLFGCAMPPPVGDATPLALQALRMSQLQAPAQAAQLALVLGGGGLRGFAHLGA